LQHGPDDSHATSCQSPRLDGGLDLSRVVGADLDLFDPARSDQLPDILAKVGNVTGRMGGGRRPALVARLRCNRLWDAWRRD
jgi:hypothetical protein